MAQLIVRDLEEGVKRRLQQRAQRHGRSMEAEIRHILRNAAQEPAPPMVGLGTRIARRFSRLNMTEELPELRGQAVRKVDFTS